MAVALHPHRGAAMRHPRPHAATLRRRSSSPGSRHKNAGRDADGDEGAADIVGPTGEEMVDAASLALRMWSEHRDTAALPAWTVVGLEVVERETFQARHSVAPLTGAAAQPLRF